MVLAAAAVTTAIIVVAIVVAIIVVLAFIRTRGPLEHLLDPHNQEDQDVGSSSTGRSQMASSVIVGAAGAISVGAITDSSLDDVRLRLDPVLAAAETVHVS